MYNNTTKTNPDATQKQKSLRNLFLKFVIGDTVILTASTKNKKELMIETIGIKNTKFFISVVL